MSLANSTAQYEAWLERLTPLVKEDLELKHREMCADPFSFLRATFYRWCEIWREVCPEAANAPKVLAVGDLHVENFGTWRDVEGRLIWGVNDFDEACPMPYTVDLVRLAASAHLAIAANHLELDIRDGCDAILTGYTEGMETGGAPVVLGERHRWLREVAAGELREPRRFWQKMDALPTFKGKVPKSAVRAIEGLMPEKGLRARLVHRIAGLGSLGRQRFVALADWRGGKIAREAKALVPSAYRWAGGRADSGKIFYEDALCKSVRTRDPFVELRGRWIVRRLAPDCSRVELSELPRKHDERRLLFEMGHETANVHLSERRAAKDIVRNLKKRPAKWLHEAAASMAAATKKDWEDWRSSRGK